MSRAPFLTLAALLLASCSQAGVGEPAFAVEDAWVRATLPGQASSAAYFSIRNAGGPDRLLLVSSPAANVSLHSASIENGVMQMRPLQSLDIPADSTVVLKPGGAHVMLTNLDQPLTVGMTVPLDLKFETSGERHVVAIVRSPNGAAM